MSRTVLVGLALVILLPVLWATFVSGGWLGEIGGFALTFLLIGIVLCWPVVAIVAGVHGIRSIGKKQCPYCKSKIPVDAIRCSHCTSEVD